MVLDHPAPPDRPGTVGRPVLVVEGQEMFRTALVRALRGEGVDARSITVANLPTFLAETSGPGLVVLDLDLDPDVDDRRLGGPDLVADLQARGWDVLVISDCSDGQGVAAAGAVGTVTKAWSFDMLLVAVLGAARGER